MAQMIARALARTPQNTISSTSRAELDKLAAEFRDELDSLGVRISDLEKHSDMVKWQGKIEYTYSRNNTKLNGVENNSSGHGGVFRLEPKAEINDHWTAVARVDASYDGQKDVTHDVFLKRVYAQGDYDKFGVKVGRFGFCPSVEDGIIADTNVSGIELTFGSKWTATVTAGRAGGGDEPEYASTRIGNNFNFSRNGNGSRADLTTGDIGTYSDDPTDIVAFNLRYNPGDQGLYGGASYYYAKDKDFSAYSSKANEDKAGAWAAALGYKFNDMVDLHGSYGRNSKADYQKDAWAVDLRFGNYGDYAERGDWAIWAGYAKFGDGAGFVSNQGDDIATGTKGWHVGAAYAPFKNVGLLVRYADRKNLENSEKTKRIWARAEFFF
jgi:hypothetical protein